MCTDKFGVALVGQHLLQLAGRAVGGVIDGGLRAATNRTT